MNSMDSPRQVVFAECHVAPVDGGEQLACFICLFGRDLDDHLTKPVQNETVCFPKGLPANRGWDPMGLEKRADLLLLDVALGGVDDDWF